MNFRGAFLIVFAALLIASCSSGREDVILYAYHEPSSELIEKLEAYASAQGVKLDTISLGQKRLGDDVWKYKGVFLDEIEGLSPQWQSDMERYVQSGGSLISLGSNVNQYEWPWMHTGLGQGVYDGGQLITIGESNPLDDVELSEKTVNSHVRSPSAPDFSRFTRIVLDADVNEPMELDILPSGRVLFIEREGNFKVFDPETNKTKLLHRFDVSTVGNYEDGMLGLAIDPDYANNSWIYIYYSPEGGHSRQNLSRFVLAYEDSLIVESEKIILEVPVQRETCCHSGGSVVFGPEGNLYLSTGDNTSSKESDGYSPLDERPGRGPFDAQKGSSNTHDLRGKILRITPTADGGYTIPEGNLFAPDGSEGRPEIYTMGCRNPFRFTVDPHTGIVYWGDVGPDSGKDSKFGPQSYDEWNQAKSPGFYGWPYFGADNKAYPMLDFATMEIGPTQDPESPVNESPNNTGARELPPARIPMIWYPYGESEHWPMLGSGSRSAMSGPVYYQPYGPSQVAFPEYYEKKLFIYEWARSWIKVVSFDDDWNMTKIEDFLPGETFVKPIDMEFDEHGAMYILEYGANYFANNVDARLVKIEFSEGNRKPIAKMNVTKNRGAAPFTTQVDATGSFDYDGEPLTYAWRTSDGQEATGEQAQFTFDQPGEHQIILEAKDPAGEVAESIAAIYVGNEPPVVELATQGNQSFFFGRSSLPYQVEVNDKEDGSLTSGDIDAGRVMVSFNYLKRANDLALLGEDFFKNPGINIVGKNAIDNSDCASCHSMSQTSIGPSYLQISERYLSDPDAPEMLADKIIEGGNGNWGHSLMAAHPQLSKETTLEMVDYILSLTAKSTTAGLPVNGRFEFDQHIAEEGAYVVGVSYTDNGAEYADPIEVSKVFKLRPPVLQAEDYDFFYDVQQQRPNGGDFAYLSNINDGSHIGFDQIDLTDIAKLRVRAMAFNGGVIKVLRGKERLELGRVEVTGSKDRSWMDYEIVIKTDDQKTDLVFAFENEGKNYLMNVDQVEFVK